MNAAPRAGRWGLALAAVVLAGYALTLAPTVTFWDAGELIAAARTLGIPHPPGTPLFVLLAHVWALVAPLGEYAVRTNLLSATASAAAAGFWFLVAHDTTARLAPDLEGAAGRVVRVGGAAAAALAGGFTFTNWQNSNETEVYSVATLTIAAVAWLSLRWRRERAAEPERAARLLLLIVYLLGLSVGNHLLALLAGPAVVVFLASVLRADPAADPSRRRAEWGQVAIVAGAWALLVGTGLGNATLFWLGGAGFALAAVAAVQGGEARFTLSALLLAAVGMTTYAFLFLRSAQHPVINEAAPATWDALVDVIRRAQYPVRTPLDDPTVPHGPGNPGRSLSMVWLQLQNYLLYFDWQWARGLEGLGRLGVTLMFASLGLRGLSAQRAADRPAFRLLFLLFLATGLGLVAYMNFKPGFSLAHDLYPNADDHEVRERDYFFVASFVVWGVWAGIGLADLARTAARRGRAALAAAVLALAVAPAALNASAATRRQTPDARLAADFAWDLLNSVPPYGVLFTYGDNDTFPLWWAQEVAGVRRDVTVVCLALANTQWYARQLREYPVRSFDATTAPAVWRGEAAVAPAGPLHGMTDEEIAAIGAQRIDRPLTVDFGAFRHTYPPGRVFYPSDVVAIRIVQQSLGRRPVVWAITAGREHAGLGTYVVQQGLGFRLGTTPPDSTSPALHRNPGRPPLDVPLTARLVRETYRYADLPARGDARLDPTSEGIARTLALPVIRLAEARAAAGDGVGSRELLELAARIAAAPELRALR
ncbi:MAG TPA: DUF2723 domain-containing protein [Gemmatimonadales bacterium]|nr:DUF2723 domain-containing protein [Gemmatimonadales bacterium]